MRRSPQRNTSPGNYSGEIDPADATRCLDVPLGRPAYDVVGKCRSRIGLVPAEFLDVVTHELLVERDGGLALFPLRDLPETRRIGREDLVDEDQRPVDVP